MTEFDRERVEARLRERGEEIERRRQEVRAGDSEMFDSELADYDQHPADEGSETFTQELDEGTLMILDEEMRNVEIARQRLAEGTYGICVDCGEQIPAARLEAIPEAIRCIKDQERYDASQRITGGGSATAR